MALEMLPAVQPGMVMVDLDRHAEAGWELLRECKKNPGETRVVMHSQDVNEETVRKAEEEGADAVVSKKVVSLGILGQV